MSVRDVGRMAVAATCLALGLPPDTLGLGAALSQTRVWAARVAAWRRDHLSWAPRWPRHLRPIGRDPVGREVPS